MNSLQISYFLAVCKYNSFTETARKLYVSQPAISKQIFALEEELGVQLFKREYKKIYLTEEGKLFRDAFEKNVSLIDITKNQAYKMKHQNHMILNIAVLQGLEPTHIIYPLLQKFESEYPNINISLECLSHEKLNTRLRLNEIDYAITLHQEVANDKLVQNHSLYSAELAFTLHSSHPLYHNKTITKGDLAGHKLLVSSAGTKNFADFLNYICKKWGVEPKQLVYLDSMDEIISYAESGSGIALLSMQPRFQKHEFRQYPLKGTTETISGAWYYNNQNPALQVLIDILSETVLLK